MIEIARCIRARARFMMCVRANVRVATTAYFSKLHLDQHEPFLTCV